jgi:imidazolonepropionase-like amidohydrolase
MPSLFIIAVLTIIWAITPLRAQTLTRPIITILKPDRVFDGNAVHEGWSVAVRDSLIVFVGAPEQLASALPTFRAPSDSVQTLTLAGMTLLPGFIEGHSHVLLHPYNETSWDDQVLREYRAERIARATVHLQKTLVAGFTTIRDLGTEGALFDDVGLKRSIEKGVLQGPRMIVAGRALVATGSYGPKGFAPEFANPLGAEEADGVDALIRAGRGTVAHAATAEGMRRAVLAGVETVEHGDGGTAEIFKLMAERGVALCPTLAAGDAIMQYRGWLKRSQAEPKRIQEKRVSFRAALAAGVVICFGGDVGVFPHGDNAREMELMVDYGMKPLDVLRSATSVNARVFHIDNIVGSIAKGLLADIICVEGHPAEHISAVRTVGFVMKHGVVVKSPFGR